MNNNIFLNVDDQEFFKTTYNKECLLNEAGVIGKKLTSLFADVPSAIEHLGPSIIQDLFLFKDGVACKSAVYFDAAQNKILWEKVWAMHRSERVTVYLRGLQKYLIEVSDVLNEIKAIFPLRTPFANIFITPSNSIGLNAHFDPTEFLVFQVSGKKIWEVWNAAPSDVAEKLYPKEMAEYCENIAHSTPPSFKFELSPGDALYIPLYYIHAPKTINNYSCHITVGLAHPGLRGTNDTDHE